MINGVGELSLEQCKEITESWSVMSDMRPLVAKRMWDEIELLNAHIKFRNEADFHTTAELERLQLELEAVDKKLDDADLDMAYAMNVIESVRRYFRFTGRPANMLDAMAAYDVSNGMCPKCVKETLTFDDGVICCLVCGERP